MKRKIVTIHLAQGPNHRWEPVHVKARCDKCRYWDKHEYGDKGTCYRYPVTSSREGSQWCGEFVPEEGA